MNIFGLIGKIEKREGFTLIELIIAIGVFTTGILGAFTLALADLKVSKDNFNRVVSANLAREGLELARNIRDSNWLRIDGNEDCEPATTDSLELCTWDQYLNNSTSNFFTLNYTTITPANDKPFSIKPLANQQPPEGCINKDIDECLSWCISAGNSDCRINLVGGFYSQNNGDYTSATNFYRLLEIKSICLQPTGSECFDNQDCSNCTGTKIGLKVTARVGWAGNNPPEHVDAIEYLYNWRR
jgi:prepilin-type N-terminal cleavage/methylation domain-containing protein